MARRAPSPLRPILGLGYWPPPLPADSEAAGPSTQDALAGPSLSSGEVSWDTLHSVFGISSRAIPRTYCLQLPATSNP